MTESNSVPPRVEGGGVTVERIFNAPRQLVWQTWTECQHFKRWYGPQGIDCHTCEIDLRVGGRHLFGLRMPDGNDYFTTGLYQEIVEPERLIGTDTMCDATGNLMGMGGGPIIETLVTLTLEDLGDGKTKVTLGQTGWPDPTMAQGSGGGWNQAFDKLEAILADA